VKSVSLWGIRKKLAITTYPKVRYPLKTPYRDGNTGDRRSHVIFEPQDFIARLAALVPKPRVYLTRFHGVFVRGGPRRAALEGRPSKGGPRRAASTKQSAPRDKTKQALPTGQE
jgi:hypothetical protein